MFVSLNQIAFENRTGTSNFKPIGNFLFKCLYILSFPIHVMEYFKVFLNLMKNICKPSYLL